MVYRAGHVLDFYPAPFHIYSPFCLFKSAVCKLLLSAISLFTYPGRGNGPFSVHSTVQNFLSHLLPIQCLTFWLILVLVMFRFIFPFDCKLKGEVYFIYLCSCVCSDFTNFIAFEIWARYFNPNLCSLPWYLF